MQVTGPTSKEEEEENSSKLLYLNSVTRWLDHLLKIWQFYNKEKWANSYF